MDKYEVAKAWIVLAGGLTIFYGDGGNDVFQSGIHSVLSFNAIDCNPSNNHGIYDTLRTSTSFFKQEEASTLFYLRILAIDAHVHVIPCHSYVYVSTEVHRLLF